MTITENTQKQIDNFAREQARHYLNRAQMTYWEKLQDKMERTGRKARRKMQRFRSRSDASVEAQDDLRLYMNDFIEDLLAQGISEEEACERACKELAYNSDSDGAADLYELYAEKYYDLGAAFNPFAASGTSEGTSDPYSALNGGFGPEYPLGSGAGLYYSGCVLVGCILGASVGLVLGFLFFVSLFWIGSLVGFFAGTILGVGIAMLLHARSLRKRA